MFEKEAKERARDYTSNKERLVAYEYGFLDGADRMRAEMQKLEEDNADLKQSLDWANEREKELKAQIEKMKCCENCAWWYKLPNGQRDCAETCENRDNWSLRK